MGLKRSNILIYLTFLWAITILLLGSWWLYLIFTYGTIIEKYTLNNGSFKLNNFVSLIKWEGGAFLCLLILLSGTILFLFIKDQKKTKSLQAFFASLTHEMKTPLASIRLQADVIDEIVENSKLTQLDSLSKRLIEDTTKLEVQMDKVLQLSRIERGGNLNPIPIDLNYFKEVIAKNGQLLQIELNTEKFSNFMADQMAFELILKNLFENTLIHTDQNHAKIQIFKKGNSDEVILEYQDHGNYQGPLKKIGKLFFKYNSSKGSGIGLYLVTKLMDKMNGSFKIQSTNPMSFELTFKKEQGHKS